MSIELNKSTDGKYHVKTSFPKLKDKLELPTQEVTFKSFETMIFWVNQESDKHFELIEKYQKTEKKEMLEIIE